MTTQEYIDHLKGLGAKFTNMEADVIATLPNIQLMITCCQLDDDRVMTGIDYESIIGCADTAPTVFLSAIKQGGAWTCLADTELGGFIELFELKD